jgi:hypothetical protein
VRIPALRETRILTRKRKKAGTMTLATHITSTYRTESPMSPMGFERSEFCCGLSQFAAVESRGVHAVSERIGVRAIAPGLNIAGSARGRGPVRDIRPLGGRASVGL